MFKNKYNNKIIIRQDVNKIKSVVPSIERATNDFFYIIPIEVDKDKLIDLNSNFKIQVVCLDNNIFKSVFPNKIYSNNLNYKSYSKSEDNVLFKNFLHKNIFSEYNKKIKNDPLSLTYKSNLDLNSFSNEEVLEGFNLNEYLIKLSSKFSRKLSSKKINNFRIIILDEKNNVVDETDILECDFRLARQIGRLVNTKLFYQNRYLNSFTESLQISLFRSGQSADHKIRINYSSEIDENMFEISSVSLTYLSENGYVSCTDDVVKLEDNQIILRENVNSLCSKVAKDYYLEKENFDFNLNIILKLNIDDSDDVPEEQKTFNITKSFSLEKNENLPIMCYIKFRNRCSREIKEDLQLDQNISLTSNSIVFNRVVINGNVPKSILEIIFIEDIKINNTSLENNMYRFREFNIENQIRFKGKSILELFTSNLFEFYCRTNIKEITFNIIVNILGKQYNFASDRIFNSQNIQNLKSSVRKINTISKNNFNISSININNYLSRNRISIFDFNKISLTNLSSYNDLAYSLGYSLNNQGDIKKFLSNCIVKIENSSKITSINLVSHNSNYFFFNELFNMDEFNSGTVSIKNIYIKNFINTDDYFAIINKKRTEINKNIIDFFLSNNEDSFRKILKTKNLNIESNIKIKILPIPKTISDSRGSGLDDLGNPTDSNVTKDLIVYLYTGNKDLSWTRFNIYKEVLMDSTKSDNVSNYSEFFDYVVYSSMSINDYYNNTFRYDKNEILNLSQIDSEVYINSSVQASCIEENFNSKYYDFSFSNREFFVESMPFSVLFQNTSYLSSNNEYKVKEIKIVKNESQNQIKIDITNLKNIYSIQQIKDSVYYVRCSIHFLMKKEISTTNSVNTENTDFINTIFSGSNCITYNNKYVDKNAANFSNVKNTIDSSKIQCSIERDKIYLVIEDSTNELNISNLNYSYFADFFDFCRDNNTNYLLKPILRFSVSFEVPQSDDFIFGVFNHNIPSINLVDKKISLQGLNKINTLIVT